MGQETNVSDRTTAKRSSMLVSMEYKIATVPEHRSLVESALRLTHAASKIAQQ